MKIGLIADSHFRSTKNIFDRLEMCKKSMLWAYQVFEEEKVDIIVNLGDVYDSSVTSAETIQAVSEVYKQHPKIHEYVVPGNHDSFNYNNSVVSHLSLHKNVTVINEPMKIDNLSFLPFRKTEDITGELLKELSNDFLFSHVDINKSTTGSGFRLPGINSEDLLDNFSYVFNGHIHHREILSQTVINVGSLTCHSFSDKPNSFPGLSIFDTETKTIRDFENPFSFIFTTIKSSNEEDLIKQLDSHRKRENRTILRVIVPTQIVSFAKEVLNMRKFMHTRVLSSKINQTETSQENRENIYQINIDEEFINFLETIDKETLKGTIEQYRKEVIEI